MLEGASRDIAQKYADRCTQYKSPDPMKTMYTTGIIRMNYYQSSVDVPGPSYYNPKHFLFDGRDALSKVEPSFEEAIACLGSGLFYDYWTAYMYRYNYTGK